MATLRRDAFQGIADPTRRDILSLLIQEPMKLNTIAKNFDVSRSAVSQHVKILAECGLVTIRKIGRERFCHTQPQKIKEVADWLEPFRELWETRFVALDSLLDDMKSKPEK